MKRRISFLAALLLLCTALWGCSAVSEKAGSLTTLYAITAVLALILLVCYLTMIRPRQLWFMVLFTSVFVVDLGYFLLSVSPTLEAALMANRLSYLGSVFLPLSMLMIILNATELARPRWLSPVLLSLSLLMFLLTATVGYLPLYYKDSSLLIIDGVSVLSKEYGPLHGLYACFLLLYFAAMVAVILWAAIRKKLQSPTQAVLLCAAVFINIAVWLLEKLIPMIFELLSMSYIFTEMFLYGLYVLHLESIAPAEPAPAAKIPEAAVAVSPEQCRFFLAHLSLLTPTERIIFDLYLQGKTGKDVLVDQNIKENTLKYHNRNIYSKLGVSSRKELLQVAAAARYNEQI